MTSTYIIDPAHSNASFTIKHMMIANVHGSFQEVTGKFVIDPQSPSNSSVEAKIQTSSISTHDAKRDDHLKSADFFDIAKFPTMTFRSTKIEKNGDGMKIVGSLTIRDVSNEVILDVKGPTEEIKDPFGNIKIGASASSRIKRSEFGLTWNTALEAGGLLVGDDVKILLDIEFVKQA